MGDLSTLKTNADLLSALEKASSRKMTRAELEEQRVSFVVSSMSSDSNITRDRVKQLLSAHEGEVKAQR